MNATHLPDHPPAPDLADPCLDCPLRVVCRCLQVTEQVLVEAITTGTVRTVKDICRHTGAGDGCTACHATLREYLERYA
jgi:bacterioferritin-associated ferredoxin